MRAVVAALAFAALAHAGCAQECATASCAPHTTVLRVNDPSGQPVTAFHGSATTERSDLVPFSCGEGAAADPAYACPGGNVVVFPDREDEIVAVLVESQAGGLAGSVDVEAYEGENRPDTYQCDPTGQCWTPDIPVTLEQPAP